MSRPVTTKERREIRRLYASGLSGTEVARRVDRPKRTVYFHVSDIARTRRQAAERGVAPHLESLSKEELDRRMAAHYASGKRASDVASYFGCSIKTVTRAVRRHGGFVRKTGPKPKSRDRAATICQLRDRGLTWAEIGRRVGLSYSAARNHARNWYRALGYDADLFERCTSRRVDA